MKEISTSVSLRPRFEGSNICSWIGFKHVMYLVEEAILEHFRQVYQPAQELFETYGLCLEIVSSDVRILHALHMNDVAQVHVSPRHGDGPELHFAVVMTVDRNARPVKCLTGKVKVLMRWAGDAREGDTTALATLGAHTVSLIERRASTEEPPRLVHGAGGSTVLARPSSNAFVWKHRVPYFYCHFSERLQHSGYLRIMEEIVDLFLADRGISIRTMLDTRNWIPVVPKASFEILREAYMEEMLHNVFTVTEIFKGITYTARVDSYVERDAELVHVATGEITHGYAAIQNRRDWSLVEFDAETVRALEGNPPR